MDENEQKQRASEIVEQIKELVRKGNVARIMLKHNGSTILNIPLNVGIAGTIFGIAAAPWALIASAIATLGFDCKIELEKTNGEIVEIVSRDVGERAVNTGTAVINEFVDDVKNTFGKK